MIGVVGSRFMGSRTRTLAPEDVVESIMTTVFEGNSEGKTERTDPGWKWLYRWGGISALVLGMSYIVIVGLVRPRGPGSYVA